MSSVDPYGSGLDRIIRDFELRLQRLETDSRVKPGLTVSFPEGSAVANPPNFESATDAGAEYDGATRNMINQIRTDAAGTKIAMDNLLTSLRQIDVIRT